MNNETIASLIFIFAVLWTLFGIMLFFDFRDRCLNTKQKVFVALLAGPAIWTYIAINSIFEKMGDEP